MKETVVTAVVQKIAIQWIQLVVIKLVFKLVIDIRCPMEINLLHRFFFCGIRFASTRRFKIEQVRS